VPLVEVAAEAADDARVVQALEQRHFIVEQELAVDVGGQRNGEDFQGHLAALLDVDRPIDLALRRSEPLFQRERADSRFVHSAKFPCDWLFIVIAGSVGRGSGF
jgi:hypothetical protein